MCKSHLQSVVDVATHYKLACRSLFEEAIEVTSLQLEVVSDLVVMVTLLLLCCVDRAAG